MKNIVLIGMPGAGKSTIGVILAKVLGLNFLDTDLLIQEKEKSLLKDIIAKHGIDGFISIENQVILKTQTDNSVIATGGSVIYGKEAMKHLKEIGIIVYLQLNYETISKRLSDIKSRGVVLRKDQNLKMLYEERCPLYEKYADIIVNGEGLNTEEYMEKLVKTIKDFHMK